MALQNKRNRFIAGFCILFILYSAYFLLTRDGFFHIIHTTRKLRHVISFVAILLVYVAGLWAFNKQFPYWTRAAWNLLHIIFIIILLVFGIIDWWIGGLPKGSRHFTQTISETLVSPILYIAIGLLDWSMGHLPSSKYK